jgi:hypothetical protein
MMKKILGLAAILVLSVASGCATTQSEGGGRTMSQSLAAGGKAAPLQCMPGWSACVCDKTEKCCSPRLDCSCDGGGHAACS